MSKFDKSLYEQQEDHILEKSDAFITLLTKRGILGDSKIDDQKVREAKKERQKLAYHNTEMLMKNYRHIIWQTECEAGRIADELNLPLRNLDAILSRIDAEIGMGNRRIEGKLESLNKLRALVDRVNEALSLLKKKPDNGDKLYEVIYLTFITPEKLTQNDILYRLDMSRRHYYRLREQALTVLSIRLWAAPTSELDMWLDLMTLVDKDF